VARRARFHSRFTGAKIVDVRLPAVSAALVLASAFSVRIASGDSNVAHVNLESDEPDQTFHIVGRGLVRLCTAPCSVEVPVGYQRFAIADRDGKMLTATADVEVRDGATIRASRVKNGGLRALGIVLTIVGPIAGLALVFASVKTHQSCDQTGICSTTLDFDQGLLYAGSLLIPATVGPGIVLIVLGRDRARFEVETGMATPPTPRDIALRRTPKEGASWAPGLTATLHF
jgi:hypothetical protein